MKYFPTILVIVFICSINLFAQNTVTQKINEGYFSNPVKTNYGIVASNEFESSLYLINSSDIEELINAPGCGRYFSINKEGNLIGFKLINPDNGLQSPAILDLSNKKVTKLAEETENAGQVSFADDGAIVYSVDNELFVKSGSSLTKYNLGIYSNRTPVSPDGKSVIFKDDDDQLWIFDLSTSNKIRITDSKNGYGNASWSPDGNNILFTSIGTDIFVYNFKKQVTFSIGEGENPNWSPDGKLIIYHKKEIDFNKIALINSDIYLSNADGSIKGQVTNTKDECEMDAKFSSSSNVIIYHNYLKREIVQKNIESGQLNKSSGVNVICKSEEPLSLNFFNLPDKKANFAKSNSVMEWVHIHQVWDTRNSGSWYSQGEGYVCCGATSAMEVLASYGILKPWPMTTYGHTSNYGLYISDPYTYNGYTYSGYDGWPSGAHGYMWNGSGSPYANTVNFLKRHGITDTKRDESVSWNDVMTEINAGYPYIVCSTGLTSGHIVVIIGQSGTGHTVICNDPYGDKNVGSYGSIRNGKNAIYDWSDANTGREKVTPVVWAVTARFNQNISPEVLSYSPASPTDSIAATSAINVSFSQQMDTVSAAKAFSIVPNVEGTITWMDYNQTLSFIPSDHFSKSTKYTVTVDTTAKSFWMKNLATNLTFEFVVKNREHLGAFNLYPENNQEGISTTVQFRIAFDAQVPNTAFTGNIFLYNSAGVKVNVANAKIKTIDGKTYLTFEPKNQLEANCSYTLVYYNKIYDVENYHLQDTIRISFTTEAANEITGSILDDFETIKEWKNPSFSESTTGVDTTTSIFSITNSRKFQGLYTGKILYTFTNNSGGVCRIYNAAKPGLGSLTNSNLGLYVFGDNSKNTLELWFNDVSGDKIIELDTLNWTGWKLKSVDLSKLNSNGDIQFNSIVIRQNQSANLSGELYFDNLMSFSTTGVEQDNSTSLPVEFQLFQNYPNPFNPNTTIKFSLPEDCRITITIYNSVGEMVKEVLNESQSKGLHQVDVDGSKLTSGVYFYSLNAISANGNKSYSSSKKLIMLK